MHSFVSGPFHFTMKPSTEFKGLRIQECPPAPGIETPEHAAAYRQVMFESKPLTRTEPDPSVRKLKIEADGDFWKGRTKPKIRLMGQWLERAGFSPGTHVCVTCVALGVIELRSPNASTVNEPKPPEW